MITRDEIYDFIHSLKSHTLSSFREHNRNYVPFIMDQQQFGFEVVDRYHYKDHWYSYRYSDDNPKDTIGIIEITNMPYWTFKHRINQRSFIASIEQLTALRLITPFLLFLDNKYVSWSDIDIIYDCGTTYVLLHGDQYNWHRTLEIEDIKIVTLPYNIEFIGTETDSVFESYLSALTEFLSRSQYLDDNNNIHVQVPTVEDVINIDGIQYNIGYWIYKELRLESLGKLSPERLAALKNIKLEYSVYNASGVSLEKYTTRFNAIDKDSYDNSLYNDICNRNASKYEDNFLMGFNNSGKLDSFGTDRFYIFTTDVYHDCQISSSPVVYGDHNNIDNVLQRENYLIFKNGLLDADCKMITGINNLYRINNPDTNIYTVYTFYYTKLEKVYQFSNIKFRRDYLNEQAKIYFDETRWKRGLLAILMDENGNLTDRVISRLEAYIDSHEEQIFDPDGNLDDEYSLAGLLLDSKLNNTDTIFRDLELNPVSLNNHTIKIKLIAAPATGDIDDKPVIRLRGLYNNIAEVYIKDGKAYYKELVQPDEYAKIDGSYQMFIDYYKIDNESVDYNTYMNYIVGWLNVDGTFNVSLLAGMKAISSKGSLDSLIIDTFQDKNYLMPLESIIFIDNEDEERHDYIEDCMNYLDFNLDRHIPYEDNMEEAYKTILKYDATMLNRLNHCRVESVCYTGSEANLYISNGILDIPRNNWEDNESYCLIFVNGELIENYDKIIVYNSKFSIPVDKEFFESDTVEILYFKQCCNNAIRFDSDEYKPGIFDEYIHPEDLKIFADYPEDIIKYPTLVKPSFEIAFNVMEDGKLMVHDDHLIAASSRRFIYQRLHVDKKSYRMRLAARFKYCDDRSHYVLFINGRRVPYDEYFITVPKYTRPFWAIYLYTARFVTSDDRIELFYLPMSMLDINTAEQTILSTDGYIETDPAVLEVPYDNQMYGFWVGGKKIPSRDLEMVSSCIMRVKKDQLITYPLIINAFYDDVIPEVEQYMDENLFSMYDSLIHSIRRSSLLGLEELDRLFGIFAKMTNYEDSKIKPDVGHIAVLNEIVRDFWVSSGYPYHDGKIFYDYDIDELFEMTTDGTMVIPALDANQIINIPKEDRPHILYFYPRDYKQYYEIGSSQIFDFIWEYSEPLLDTTTRLNLLWQSINNVRFDPDVRSLQWHEAITEDTRFVLTGYDNGRVLDAVWDAKFVYPIYYGAIDEARIRNYKRSTVVSIDDLIAVVPKNGKLPTTEELEAQMEARYILEDLYKDNFIFRPIGYILDADTIIPSVNIMDLIAIFMDDDLLMNDRELDKLAEEGLEYVKQHYRWTTFDDVFFVDPYINMTLVWLKTLKAIIPEDWHDVTGFYNEPETFERISDYLISVDDNGQEFLKDDNNYRTFQDILLYDVSDESQLIGRYDRLLISPMENAYMIPEDRVYQDEEYILFDEDTKFVEDNGAEFDHLYIAYGDDNIEFWDDAMYAIRFTEEEWDALGNRADDYHELVKIVLGVQDDEEEGTDKYYANLEDELTFIEGIYLGDKVEIDPSYSEDHPDLWNTFGDEIHNFDYIGKHDTHPVNDKQKAREIYMNDSWLMDLNINDAELTRNFFAIVSDVSVLRTDFRERDLIDRYYDQWSTLGPTNGELTDFYTFVDGEQIHLSLDNDEDWYDIDNPETSDYFKTIKFLMGGSNSMDDPDEAFERYWTEILDDDRIELFSEDFHNEGDNLFDVLKVQLYMCDVSDYPRYFYINPTFVVVYDDSFTYNDPSKYTVYGGVYGWEPEDKHHMIIDEKTKLYLEDLAAIVDTDVDHIEDKSLDDFESDGIQVIREFKLYPAKMQSDISTYMDFMAILLNEDGTLSDRIIRDIGLESDMKIPEHAVNIDDPDMFALLENGERWYTKFTLANVISDIEISTDSDLDILISHLDKELRPDAEIDVNYAVGNYRNFIMAFPRRYIYNAKNYRIIDFFTPDLSNSDLRSHTYNYPSTPLYTSGIRDIRTNTLKELTSINMSYMGECNYRSEYGVIEPYVVYRTDGYFTRIYENYKLQFMTKNK